MLQKRTAEFGDAVEYLLRKHGKKIVNEQMQLERVADSAIALFAMTATISRSSASLTAGNESAEHEKKLTVLYCDVTSSRIQTLLRDIKMAGKRDEQLREIAAEVLTAGKYIPRHATGIDC